MSDRQIGMPLHRHIIKARRGHDKCPCGRTPRLIPAEGHVWCSRCQHYCDLQPSRRRA